MSALVLALVIVAGILAVVDLVRTRGTHLTARAALALAIALALPALAAV